MSRTSPHDRSPSIPDPGALDVRRVRERFERAASQYDPRATLDTLVATGLMEHLEPVQMAPDCILDAGAGIGICSRQLVKYYRSARLVTVDFAPAMVRAAKHRAPRWFSKQSFVCADAGALPVADECVDLLVSNLMLPYCSVPDPLLAEFRRVLRPGGLLMFSTLGPDTLKELRESWAAVDTHVHVHPFMDMHDIGDAMMRAGFGDVVMDTERAVLHYARVVDLMMELKRLGAGNSALHRCRGLTGRGRLAVMTGAYESHREEAGLPASYEVVYGHGWRGSRESVEIPLADLKSKLRRDT